MKQDEKQSPQATVPQRKYITEGFQLPSGITFDMDEVDNTLGSCSVYPFERGYGTTIANALRRALISSISGYAVTAIKITSYDKEGTAHAISNEFETIPGVYDDTVDIINNLKKLCILLRDDGKQTMLNLSLENEQIVKAVSLDRDNVAILNPEQYLFTMAKDAKVDILLQIDFGRGYVPAHTVSPSEELGVIPIDAIFSPIRNVRFTVGSIRVGTRSDFDKIEMEIKTNGTVSPSTALGEAAKFLKDSLSIFINFYEESQEASIQDSLDALQLQKLKASSIDELELSARARNCLDSIEIKTIGDLTTRKESEIVSIKNLGKKSLNEIKDKMLENNLTFRPEDNYT